jgi:hypothetical protein
MAKRTPVDERPYRPLEQGLVRAVIAGSTSAGDIRQPDSPATAIVPSAAPADSTPTVDIQPQRHVAQPQMGKVSTAAAPNSLTTSLSPVRERLAREKRVLMTATEERALERTVSAISAALGTSIKLSHVLRATVTILLHSESEILERAKLSPKLTRPPNGDPLALEHFERTIAQLISSALRDGRVLR